MLIYRDSAQRGPTFHLVFLFVVDRAILLDRHVVVLLYVPISLPVHKQQTAGTSLPATKALLIPLWYNLENTIHPPGSHGCQFAMLKPVANTSICFDSLQTNC
ncbi:hypothetical protein T02_10079 [Trichinella nativa]|uniref:Uncharacterized protein n=1 Tax=Trichinella nativa TaxID=6335 RepID=A0A0V1LLM7_9BILA|nr:hypothetical protein T02_10079 [Trichinella nativa]